VLISPLIHDLVLILPGVLNKHLQLSTSNGMESHTVAAARSRCPSYCLNRSVTIAVQFQRARRASLDLMLSIICPTFSCHVYGLVLANHVHVLCLKV